MCNRTIEEVRFEVKRRSNYKNMIILSFHPFVYVLLLCKSSTNTLYNLRLHRKLFGKKGDKRRMIRKHAVTSTHCNHNRLKIQDTHSPRVSLSSPLSVYPIYGPWVYFFIPGYFCAQFISSSHHPPLLPRDIHSSRFSIHLLPPSFPISSFLPSFPPSSPSLPEPHLTRTH